MAPVQFFPDGEGIGDLCLVFVPKQICKQPECGAHIGKLSTLVNKPISLELFDLTLSPEQRKR